MTIDWAYIVAACIGVVGGLEYIKGFFKDAPTIAWRIMLPIVCLGVAIAGDGGIYQIATDAIIMLAICQIGYDKLIAFGKGKIG